MRYQTKHAIRALAGMIGSDPGCPEIAERIAAKDPECSPGDGAAYFQHVRAMQDEFLRRAKAALEAAS